MAEYKIPLSTDPSQEFSTTIENKDITITLKDKGIMLFSVFVGGKYICQNALCFANQPILAYPYMVSEMGGNFIFLTENDEYPNYENFNTTCNLYYITED